VTVGGNGYDVLAPGASISWTGIDVAPTAGELAAKADAEEAGVPTTGPDEDDPSTWFGPTPAGVDNASGPAGAEAEAQEADEPEPIARQEIPTAPDDGILAAILTQDEAAQTDDPWAAREVRLRADLHAADLERAAETERHLREQEERTRPMTAEEIDADLVASILLPPTAERPRVFLERLGPSYRAIVRPLGARFTFRDVRTDRDLSADVTVNLAGRHLFRSTVTLSLTGREKVAKVAAELAGGGNGEAWRRATFAAVEGVLEAEERLGAPVDLRSASLALPAGGLHVVRPIWPHGSMVLVMPGDGGKSTIARALAVSIAGGITVIPGIEPIGPPRPVLYVAGEDPVAYWHSRSIESICRGLEIDRASIAEPIELFDARGRPLHRIARAIAERAADFGAIILDSQQALLSQTDQAGGIRDRDGLFWNAIDEIERPTCILAHPNRADAKTWRQADGRVAGSEVNRDRARMLWRGTWEDDSAAVGTSCRRYTLENVKNNHGAREAPLGFAAWWELVPEGDPGILRFMATDPTAAAGAPREPTPLEQTTLDAFRAGNTTPAALGKALGIATNAAKSRLWRLREAGLIKEEGAEA
jgi:hypothetical protein